MTTTAPRAAELLRAMYASPDPATRGRIYLELRPVIEAASRTGEDPVTELCLMAANTLGTLTAELVSLRTLDLLRVHLPVLDAITTDFSAEEVRFGQAITTRKVSFPAVGDFSTSTGYGISSAQATDVAVTIDTHEHVTIAFNANETSGTGRNLFGEQVEAMVTALGKSLVDKLYALFTEANYPNATTVATAFATRGTIPLSVAAALNSRGVPSANRTLLLSSEVFAKLAEDAAVVKLATYRDAKHITDFSLPMLSGLRPVLAVNLPTTGNMTGFGLHKSAALLASRLPADYMEAIPNAAHGRTTRIVHPEIGLSFLKTDFVDHSLGAAVSRVAWVFGVAVGHASAGQVVKSE